MTVSLPATQKDYVRERATASGCSTPSEYIRRLIHADQTAQDRAKLQQLIQEGLASPLEVMTPKTWEKLRTDLVKQLEKHRGNQ